jgi:glutathione-regulated potassium-efflux system ancillary protein KefF
MPDTAPTDILVLVAHPTLELSRVNRRLKKTAKQVTPRVEVRDLYRLYPDYLIDVATEQQRLAQAKLVVWQHPFHWYGPPPLMKLWIDEVLTFGWAYGPGGHALRGKDVWLVCTTGGAQESYRPDRYNRYFFDAFLPPYEQTAVLCGMRFLPPLVLHGAHRVNEQELVEHADVYAERLKRYPHWPEIEEMGACPECEVPENERPREEQPALAEGAA